VPPCQTRPGQDVLARVLEPPPSPGKHPAHRPQQQVEGRACCRCRLPTALPQLLLAWLLQAQLAGRGCRWHRLPGLHPRLPPTWHSQAWAVVQGRRPRPQVPPVPLQAWVGEEGWKTHRLLRLPHVQPALVWVFGQRRHLRPPQLLVLRMSPRKALQALMAARVCRLRQLQSSLPKSSLEQLTDRAADLGWHLHQLPPCLPS